MGFHSHLYPRPLIPNTQDPTAVDFRAFYPYTPNEVKHRKRTTTQQLKVLEAVFKGDTKPNAQRRQGLASDLNMTARGVQVWFQNRRAKEKARAGRVSLAKSTSFVDELKEEETHDGVLYNIVKTEALSVDLLLGDETPGQLNSSPSPPSSDTNPPSHAPSPPELRVITDSAVFNWADNDVNEAPPDSTTSCASASFPTISTCTTLPNTCLDLDSEELYALRRGSLPVTSALYRTQVSQPPSDPLFRRCSVDASLQRLALHPYANLARAKNSALYGAGVGVASSDSASHDVPSIGTDGTSHHHLMNYGPHRLQRRFVSSSALSAAAQYCPSLSTAQYSNVRRLSMDSRALRISSLQRMRHSPSPSPLSTYNSMSRASLPESHLYSMTPRSVGSPIPGPLPMPGFQFGAANSSTPSIASPSSIDSERNSPDSIRSFSFGGDEENQPSTPYETYTSRFGSIASIATSESSLNSAYYGGPIVDQDRRNSTCVPQYYAPPADLDGGRPEVHNLGTGDEIGIPAGIVVGYSPSEEYTSYGESDLLPLSISDMRRLQQTQPEPLRQHQAYASPSTPAIGATREIHGQDAPIMPISTSSELAFALDGKPPDLKPINIVTQSSTPEAYVNFGPDEQASQCHAEHYHAHQQPTYYTTEVQAYHQEQPAYPTTYTFTHGQVAQQPSDFGMYSTTGDYSDPVGAPPVSSDNLQTTETFVGYS